MALAMHAKKKGKIMPAQDAKATFMLRRTPREWKMSTDEDIDEAVEFCRLNRIDEVLWFIESAAAYHPFVDEEGARARADWLCRAREKLRRAGIIQSLNVLFVIGHGEYGYRLDGRFKTMVGSDGRKSAEVLCPLSPEWRRWAEKFFGILAGTKPARLWVDDDFRYYNHGRINPGCFCERHMREFARRAGRARVSREELVAAILRPGEPHPWRKIWINLLDDSLGRAARIINRAVRAKSPRTETALMVTAPFLLVREGRDLKALLHKLCAPHAPVIRMPTCAYAEGSARDYYPMDEGLKRFRPLLAPGTRKCTEIETMPYHAYGKSALSLARQMEWATILGAPNHTLNIFDRMTTPFADQPDFGRMLRGLKPRLSAIAAASARVPRFRGVRLYAPGRSSLRVRTREGKSFRELLPYDSGWADALRAFGFPVQFECEEEVSALTGEAPRLMGTGLEGVFKRGVLLDLSALETLRAMGREDLAGVKLREILDLRATRLHGYERLDHPAFGGGPDHRTAGGASSSGGRLGILDPGAGAQVISWIEEGESRRNLYPGAVISENSLGGRVCVYPYEFINRADADMYAKGTSHYFYSEYRRRQLRGVVDWLARGCAAMSVEAPGWILPHRADGPGGIFMSAMNINLDPWPKISIAASLEKRRASGVKVLASGDCWKRLAARRWRQEGGRVIISDGAPLAPLEIRCYFVETDL